MRVIRGGLTGVAAASMVLAGCVSNDGLPEATPMNPPEMYRIVAATDGCPSFTGVTLDALPPSAWQEPPLDARRARLQAGPVPGSRPAVLIDVQAFTGNHSAYGARVIATRLSDQMWQVVDHVTSTYSFPAPPPLGSQSSRPTAPSTTSASRRWQITGDAARRLDAFLAGRCLAAEPRAVTFLASCTQRPQYIDMELQQMEGIMRFRQDCGRGGAAGEVITLVLSGAP